MGREIAEALDGRVDLFCAGVGTGGGLMGTLDGLEAAGVFPEAFAFEPAQSPFLTTGQGGPHKIEGTEVGFEPPFLDRSRLKEARAVDQELAFDMCRRLAREEGIFTGTSTGMNVADAIAAPSRSGSPWRPRRPSDSERPRSRSCTFTIQGQPPGRLRRGHRGRRSRRNTANDRQA